MPQYTAETRGTITLQHTAEPRGTITPQHTAETRGTITLQQTAETRGTITQQHTAEPSPRVLTGRGRFRLGAEHHGCWSEVGRGAAVGSADRAGGPAHSRWPGHGAPPAGHARAMPPPGGHRCAPQTMGDVQTAGQGIWRADIQGNTSSHGGTSGVYYIGPHFTLVLLQLVVKGCH